MELKQPRAPRHQIKAAVEVVDSVSGRCITAHTSDVGPGGCYIKTPVPLEVRSTIRVHLSFNGTTLTMYGDVVRSDPNKGMGLKFRGLLPEHRATLKRWLFALSRPDYSEA